MNYTDMEKNVNRQFAAGGRHPAGGRRGAEKLGKGIRGLVSALDREAGGNGLVSALEPVAGGCG